MFIQIILFFFPWKIRRWFLTSIFKFEIHSTARIGFSIILSKKLKLEEKSRIGHLVFCKKIDNLYLNKYSTIGNLNFITGFSTSIDDFAYLNGHFAHDLDRKCELVINENSAITSKHFLDCNGGIYIGKFTTIAGIKSTFLTHSIDIYKNRQDTKPILIGDYCFVGTGCIILGGSILPNYSVLGAGAVLSKKYTVSNHLYGGVPAKPIKNLDNNDVKYFTRKNGFVV